MKEIVEKVFKDTGIDINNEQLTRFDDFFSFLKQENEKYNLTRIVSPEDVAVKHFLDSVQASCFIPQNSSVIDVGAGAGFPSIPLKIMRNDLKFTLVDSVNKKIEFLKNVSHILGQDNQCVHERVEDLGNNVGYREMFDVCVARAVADLSVLVEYCLPFVKVGGVMIAYKSFDSQAEIENAKTAIAILGGRLKQVKEYKLEEERKNILVIIEKIGRTPKKYPRRGNKPRLSPLK